MNSQPTKYLIFAIGILSLHGAAKATDQDLKWNLNLETGAAWQNRNDVRIPGDNGTLFALDKLVGSGPVPYYRLELTYRFAPRHSFRLLYAPFEYRKKATLDKNVAFVDRTFTEGQSTEATYRFNSYRATYRYLFHNGAKWKWNVGFTGKIRDAEIALSQNGETESSSNVGFVPLLNLVGSYKLTNYWKLVVDFDGLASTQGRAFDLGLFAQYDIATHWTLSGGYRTLEGGADNDRVFNFAWINYAVVSLGARF
jgi:hypothetical protein